MTATLEADEVALGHKIGGKETARAKVQTTPPVTPGTPDELMIVEKAMLEDAEGIGRLVAPPKSGLDRATFCHAKAHLEHWARLVEIRNKMIAELGLSHAEHEFVAQIRRAHQRYDLIP